MSDYCQKCHKKSEFCSCPVAPEISNTCGDCEYWRCVPSEPLPGLILKERGECRHPVLDTVLPIIIHNFDRIRYSYQNGCKACKRSVKRDKSDLEE